MTWKMPFKKETKEKNQMQLQKDSLTLFFLVYMKDLQLSWTLLSTKSEGIEVSDKNL